MVWGGLLLGLLGSLHCVGMCGPLAMALPDPGISTARFVLGRLLYNLGRAVTYALMGLIFGLIGYGLYFVGIQQIVSITIGALILLSAIPALAVITSRWQQPIATRLKRILSPLFQKTAASGFFLIGLLNGLLPCGFVYMGIAGAILAGSALHGALFMFLFGLGTFPLMMVMSVSKRFLTPKFRFHITRIMPYVAFVVGTLLILRGLNLGIPYVSPDLTEHAGHLPGCCHK